MPVLIDPHNNGDRLLPFRDDVGIPMFGHAIDDFAQFRPRLDKRHYFFLCHGLPPNVHFNCTLMACPPSILTGASKVLACAANARMSRTVSPMGQRVTRLTAAFVFAIKARTVPRKKHENGKSRLR